jgi:hypothetical protein
MADKEILMRDDEQAAEIYREVYGKPTKLDELLARESAQLAPQAPLPPVKPAQMSEQEWRVLMSPFRNVQPTLSSDRSHLNSPEQVKQQARKINPQLQRNAEIVARYSKHDDILAALRKLADFLSPEGQQIHAGMRDHTSEFLTELYSAIDSAEQAAEISLAACREIKAMFGSAVVRDE